MFEYYIKLVVAKLNSNGSPNKYTIDDVFMCDPSGPGGTCKVFSCETCSHGSASNRKQDAQSPEYDLFDGVKSDGSFESTGIGDKMPDVLSKLTLLERMKLSVLKLSDAAFKAYAGSAGYMHVSGGATLEPNDFSGYPGILASDGQNVTVNDQRLNDALTELRRTNPLIENTLTCLEREMQENADDYFPPDSAAAMPTVPITNLQREELEELGDESGLNYFSNSTTSSAASAASSHAAGVGQEPPRSLGPQGIVGMLQSVHNPAASASERRNALEHQTVGTTVSRSDPQTRQEAPAVGTSAETSPETAIHTTLFRHGQGGHHKKSDGSQAPKMHYRKSRVGSVAEPFRTYPEFTWQQFQSANKEALHASHAKMVNAQLAQSVNQNDIDTHRKQVANTLRQANPDYEKHVDVDDTFSKSVGKDIVGGKAYWAKCFQEVIAMAVEHGVPQFFVTFTANEMGWEDLKFACDNKRFSDRAVDATRHYHHRWTQFNSTYLKIGMKTPIGTIKHKWYRQEDQARGSLHVHAAIWIERDESTPQDELTGMKEAREGICGTLPRNCQTPAQRAWRDFVSVLQRHDCRTKCHYKKGEFMGDDRRGQLSDTSYPGSVRYRAR